MASYDSADLLQRFLDGAGRPSVDESLPAALVYRYLSTAQAEVYNEVVAHAPWAMVGPPTLMTSADGGATYTFGLDADGDRIFPAGHVEIYGRADGRELYASTFDGGGDFVIEGDRVRMPRGEARVFASGPWWRGVAVPVRIDADNEPVLKPKTARDLIVYRALANWARIGGRRDPAPYEEAFASAWAGSGRAGGVGLLGMYKTQYKTLTVPARAQRVAAWGALAASLAAGGVGVGSGEFLDGSWTF